jgi:hypothetical protein
MDLKSPGFPNAGDRLRATEPVLDLLGRNGKAATCNLRRGLNLVKGPEGGGDFSGRPSPLAGRMSALEIFDQICPGISLAAMRRREK